MGTIACNDRRVELQQLRYVLAVAETRSFTRAAERCFVVQSALSHQVKVLETELGVRLFARTSRRVELTPAGEAFLPAARACLEAADRAREDALAAEGLVSGTVRLGLIPTVTAVDVPARLADLRARHPEVRVQLSVSGSAALVEAVRDGSLDVALLGLPTGSTPDGVAGERLRGDRHVAVLPLGHRWARRRRLRLADLADEVFVDFPRGTPGREQSDLAFAAAGVRREVHYDVLDHHLLLGLVEQGLAVGLLVPGVVPEGAQVRTVGLVDGPERVEHLVWSAFNPGPAALALVEVLRP